MKEIKLPDPDTHCWDDDSSKDVWSYSPELVRQIIEADRAQRGEPVAWLYEGEYSSGGYSPNYFEWRVTLNKAEAQTARRLKPLYTAPQPAQPSQPKRKPMPDNEMNDLAFQCGIQREDARDPGVEEFARAIEAFHGIKP